VTKSSLIRFFEKKGEGPKKKPAELAREKNYGRLLQDEGKEGNSTLEMQKEPL